MSNKSDQFKNNNSVNVNENKYHDKENKYNKNKYINYNSEVIDKLYDYYLQGENKYVNLTIINNPYINNKINKKNDKIDKKNYENIDKKR